MEVAQKIRELKAELPAEVCLVAVSKTKPDELIMEAYEGGHRDFGENKVQDLAAKAERLPGDIRWHMIGHLQTNKVKYIAPFVHLVHGVDSLKLLTAINKEALTALLNSGDFPIHSPQTRVRLGDRGSGLKHQHVSIVRDLGGRGGWVADRKMLHPWQGIKLRQRLRRQIRRRAGKAR